MTGRRRSALATIALAVLSLVLIAPGTAQAQRGGVRAPAPELTARWWQEFVQQDSLATCDIIVGRTLLLAGTAGGPESRTCPGAIPVGTKVLIPLINGECSVLELTEGGEPAATLAEVRACATAQGDGMTNLRLEVDGRSFDDLERLRVATGPFSLLVGSDNPFGVVAEPTDVNPTTAIADGYWALLPPLSPGTHVITAGGDFVGEDGAVLFSTEVTYTLTVRPRR